MNLHRTGEKAQWEQVDKSRQSRWQKIAAATGGIVTPGNAFSLTGLGLVGFGLKDILKDNPGRGIVLIGIGRIMDVLDGYIADKTETKSPLGEGLDVVIDKLEAAAALPVFYKTGLAPKPVLAAFFGQNLANAAVTTYAKHKNRTIHPSKEGKLNTGGQWGTIGLYALSNIANSTGRTGTSEVINSSAFATTAITMFLGVKAFAGYTRDAVSAYNQSPTINLDSESTLQVPQNEDNAS